MLAALAAASATASTSAGASAAAAGSSRNPLSEAGTPTGGAGSAQPAGSFGAFVDALSTGVPAASGSGSGAGAASTSASTSTPAKAPTRRRSQRLKEKKSASGNAVADPAPAASNSEDTEMDSASTSGATHDNGSETVASEAPMSVASGIPASETLVDDEHDGMDDDDLSDDDDEIDDEVLDDEDPEAGDKTISVNVADDGLKVEAQTPDGTRVATPNPAKSPSLARTAATGRASYAAALRAKPTDWHLQFEVDDCVLPLDLTIYGAIHQHQMRKMSGSASASSLIWQGVHTVKFKKVAGPAPSADAQDSSKSRSSTPPLSSLPDDAPHTKILRLLRVLHRLNLNEAEHGSRRSTLNESAFVNNKLTAKLTRQLEEPMIIASSCLPDWALDLPDKFPFLFPFATRYNYLQSTSFGYARLIIRWQSQQGRAQDSSSRRDDNIGFLGRLQRQKVRISRKHILESAIKVFEMYGSSSSVLEVEYFEEVGTGLGPTLEFYSLASREFARKSLKLWRDDDATKGGMFVHHPRGLFPAPMDAEEVTADSKQQ
jgi:E3 ubiquitin-protein ligase TRIP12